ncbi:MAG: hypothetical protein JO364_14570 [Pseudonocardiales bacterium]|nr:hypothetical protein [Pseudonocardiales bacterium]MBV9031494.1 hypothetical protein [Pseudonocardiales bacterium]
MATPGLDEGGEPACRLPRVCPSCGRLAERDPPTDCAHCGTEIPGDQPWPSRPVTS